MDKKAEIYTNSIYTKFCCNIKGRQFLVYINFILTHQNPDIYIQNKVVFTRLTDI